MRSLRWITIVASVTLGASASAVNAVPSLLGEVGEARGHRSNWSQAAEFVSLILDSGWAWAGMAVAAGWMVSKGQRPAAGTLAGALAGFVGVLAATITYYLGELLFQGTFIWDWRVRIWLVGTLVLGSPLGIVGASIRRSGPIGALAALAVPVGAVINMALLPPPGGSAMATPVVVTVCTTAAAAAVVVLARATRTRRRGEVRFEGSELAHDDFDNGLPHGGVADAIVGNP